MQWETWVLAAMRRRAAVTQGTMGFWGLWLLTAGDPHMLLKQSRLGGGGAGWVSV